MTDKAADFVLLCNGVFRRKSIICSYRGLDSVTVIDKKREFLNCINP